MLLHFYAPVEPAEIVNQLFPNVWVLVTHLLATIILLILLTKWVYNPFRKAMRARRNFIQNQISEAMQKHANASANEKESLEKIAHAQKEAQSIIKAATDEAKSKKLYILQSARKEINNLNTLNQNMMRNRKKHLQKEIEKIIVENAFMTAQEILKSEIDAKKHQLLINDFIENFDLVQLTEHS